MKSESMLMRVKESTTLTIKFQPSNPQSDIIKNKNMLLVMGTQGSEKHYFFYNIFYFLTGLISFMCLFQEIYMCILMIFIINIISLVGCSK